MFGLPDRHNVPQIYSKGKILQKLSKKESVFSVALSVRFKKEYVKPLGQDSRTRSSSRQKVVSQNNYEQSVYYL
jgi:hypothetical protein